MKSVQFTFIPFTRNVIDILLQDSATNNSLFIFPTEAGKRAAIRELQNRWAFQNVQFLTMQELKETIFITPKPIVKEEKRTLAFYASLTESDKDFFKINTYFQSIEPALNFFNLWEEFNEELLSDDFVVSSQTQKDAELLNWQIQTLRRLITIKKNYAKFLQACGFIDVIFTSKISNLDVSAFSSFQSVHFINQFYYTKLEQEILTAFCEHGKRVHIYYQLTEELVNKETLAIHPFTIEDLGAGRTEQIDIIECNDDFSMLRGLIQQIHAQKLRHVVHFSATHHPYGRFLSPLRFNLGRTQNFSTTSVFQFFKQMCLILEHLQYEPAQHKILVPIQQLLNALLNKTVSTYFFKNEKLLRDSVLDYLYKRIDQDYKFIDLDGDVISRKNDKIYDRLDSILQVLKRFIDTHSLSSFIDKIDTPDGVFIDDLLTDQEKSTSNIREVFYRTLSDFYSIEKSGIVKEWRPIFGHRRFAPQAQTAAGILRLFIDYLKSRSIRLFVAPAAARVEFIDLHDTRNIYYKNVAIMNVVEKEIPYARQTPYLFTESQRRVLGLKTYEDIKLREKYYFMRLVLTTPHMTLLTQKNLAQNIEISSFVEEIKIFSPTPHTRVSQIVDENYAAVYQYILKPQRDYHAAADKIRHINFYTLPLQPKRDFPQQQLKLSYYALANLLNNAFTFYIRNVIRLDEQPKRVAADYSPKLIGTIVHQCLSFLWRDILDQHIVPPVEIDFSSISENFIKRAVDKTLRTEFYYYCSPHNHAQVYFEEIVLPRIFAGIHHFFLTLDRIGLSRTPLQIYPERDYVMDGDDYRLYLKLENLKLTIKISGRADLRIEAPTKSLYYIFDYKTGHYSREQLILYELYYYLLKDTATLNQVYSYFYQVMKQEHKELRDFNTKTAKQDIFANFEHSVYDHISALGDKGFTLPDKKAGLEDMIDVTRADLYATKYVPMTKRLM